MSLLDELIFGTDSPSQEERYAYLEMKAFSAMEEYLRQKIAIKSVELFGTILEGDDLKKEVTIMHENSFKDMDKVFNLLGKETPPESVKMKQIIKNVDETLSIIKEYRAKKRDRDE